MKHQLLSAFRMTFRPIGISSFFLILLSSVSQATPLQLIYNGTFNTQNALNLQSQPTTFFTSPTPFTLNAWFDTNTQNYAPPSPPAPPPFAGFRAYAPSLATITIGGTVYTVDTITTNPIAGLTVGIFDQNTFTPGRYGIGILQQPPQDGAGFIADFGGASPNFNAANLLPTEFTGYYGVGYSSGVCLQGTGENCAQAAVTPFVLRSGSQVFSLTLGNYEEDYPAANPSTGSIAGPLNSAQLVATPEPATSGLICLTFLLLLGAVAFRNDRGAKIRTRT